MHCADARKPVAPPKKKPKPQHQHTSLSHSPRLAENAHGAVGRTTRDVSQRRSRSDSLCTRRRSKSSNGNATHRRVPLAVQAGVVPVLLQSPPSSTTRRSTLLTWLPVTRCVVEKGLAASSAADSLARSGTTAHRSSGTASARVCVCVFGFQQG